MTRCVIKSFKTELPLEYVCAKTITEHGAMGGKDGAITLDQTSIKRTEQEMGLESNTIQCLDFQKEIEVYKRFNGNF